ncbi:MAG TPA: hypothetical protein VEL79_10750 [Vicinamibacterales bacterium]|nr:hypothetical protein [Vicinamibacterales bacterium]
MFLLHCIFSIAASVVGGISSGVLGASYPVNPFLNPGLFIANGIAAGIACRRISSDGARWVWIPWAVLILYGYRTEPENMWHQVFSSHCGDTECLGQLFYGVPFVGSVAYAVSSLVVRWDAGTSTAPHGL